MSQSGGSRLGRALHRLEDAIIALTLAAMVVAALTQIVLRNALGVTLFWTEPLVRILVLWGGLLGAATAVRERKHIRIEAGLRLCPARWRRYLEVLAALVAAGTCAVLAYIGARFVRDEFAYGGGGILGLDAWQIQLVFPLAFAIMAARFLWQAIAVGRG